METEQEYPETPDQCIKAPDTAEGLLSLARSLIEDDLLTAEQLADLQRDPDAFLRSLLADPISEDACRLGDEVRSAIVTGYFQSLLAKRVEGEKYSQVRLAQVLLKAQIVAIEALEHAVGETSTTPADKARIAEVLKS